MMLLDIWQILPFPGQMRTCMQLFSTLFSINWRGPPRSFELLRNMRNAWIVALVLPWVSSAAGATWEIAVICWRPEMMARVTWVTVGSGEPVVSPVRFSAWDRVSQHLRYYSLSHFSLSLSLSLSLSRSLYLSISSHSAIQVI